MFDIFIRKSRYIYIYIRIELKGEGGGRRGTWKDEREYTSVSCLERVGDSRGARTEGDDSDSGSWVRDVTSLQRCGTLTPALTNLGETKISHGQSPTTCRVILGRPRSLSSPQNIFGYSRLLENI